MHLAHIDQHRTPTRAAGALPLGSILGSVQVPGHVIRLSDQLAGEFYTAAEEIEFCGDQVETFAIPPWASRDGAAWLPDLAALGYRRADSGHLGGREELLVATAAADMHTDDEGLVLMVVLHNDGLSQ